MNDEIEILRRTGCYADFTLPSAPSPTQTRKINSIYYAIDDPHRPKSHDWGTDVGIGAVPRDGLMIIQGPLVLNWRRRRWGILPRIENGCLQGNQPPTLDRLDDWLRARVQVVSRPDWYFVKLHTHGATEENQRVLLGEPMREFHRALARKSSEEPGFHFHYVTAREMYNLVASPPKPAGREASPKRETTSWSSVVPGNRCRMPTASSSESRRSVARIPRRDEARAEAAGWTRFAGS